MSTTVLKHKRSNTQNSVPGTTDVVFGEIALNTFDGRLYFKKNDGSGETIVTLLEVTEENLSVDSSQLTYSTSNNLKNVINDLDDAIGQIASGGGGSGGAHVHDDLFALIFSV